MLKPKKIQFDKFWTQIEQTNHREIVALSTQDLRFSQYGANKWTKQSGFQHLKHSLYFNLLPKLLKCTILRGETNFLKWSLSK